MTNEWKVNDKQRDKNQQQINSQMVKKYDLHSLIYPPLAPKNVPSSESPEQTSARPRQTSNTGPHGIKFCHCFPISLKFLEIQTIIQWRNELENIGTDENLTKKRLFEDKITIFSMGDLAYQGWIYRTR